MSDKDIRKQCNDAIQQLRDDFIRMERQLAAAERLYEAAYDYLPQYIHSDGSDRKLRSALSDYANAKEQK